ncbi:Uncharacterised protein [uncultured archaeon]|nr:Uncharacterised protein [uncultured archaeon]
MNVTRHISIDDEHVEKMKPYVEKHHGNFGAAIREMINRAGKYSPRMNSSAIDISLFNWMLKEIDDRLVPDDILDELIDPGQINSIAKLEDYLNRRFSELEWHIYLTLKCDNDMFPSNILMEIGGEPLKIKFVARLLSHFLVKNSLEKAPLQIISVVNFNECIKVEMARSDKKASIDSLVTFFGGMDEVTKVVKNKPDFWKSLVNRHLSSNYNMVTIHRNYFEDMLASNTFSGEVMIENLAKKPIREIPMKEMLLLIKEVYETSRVVDRVEIDKESLTLYHNYRNRDAIENLKKSLISLLDANGHLYDAKLMANMIYLTHRPDVGMKINEIVGNLKTSKSNVDQELIMFMAFLKGLKDMPDIPLSLSALGRRIGKSLMEEYEKENDIKKWNLETFQKALELVDSRLHRESEWKLDGNNLLYIVKKCNIANEGNKFDTSVCHTARETFKGAMNYAMGNEAELEIKHLLTHGDKFCEVVIRIP